MAIIFIVELSDEAFFRDHFWEDQIALSQPLQRFTEG
jgi:hypothetical protein